MVIATLAFVTFISNNPGFAAWLIGGLFAIIGALVASYWIMISSRLTALETVDHEIEERVSNVEVAIGKYEEHIGAGDRMFKQLMDRVERHMTEEEDQVWTGMSKLSDKLGEIHEDNLKAHASIVERLVKVESRLPNGELGKIQALVKEIAAKVGV